MPVIKTQDLSFVYGQQTAFEKAAIKNVNIEINKGEFIGIIGHTGSGKSTLIQHFNGLLKPTSGKIFIDDEDIWEKEKEIRKIRFKVGLVFQYPEYQLFEETVAKDIAFGPKNMGLSEEEINERVLEAARFVGLKEKHLKKSPFELSGGQKRRAAIAGVIAMNPEVLILDEPTAGLDPQGKREILSLVKSINKQKGITVVMVSHDMNEVYENADRVIVFRDGGVVYDLPPRQLFKLEDQIVSMNLEIPQMAQFTNALEKQGIVLPDDCITVDQIFDALCQLKGGSNV